VTDLDDLQLRRTPETDPPVEKRRAAAFWIAVVLLVLGVAGAAYLLFGKRDRSMETLPTARDTENPAEPRVPLGGPPENIVVPPLDESDELVRQLVSAISSHPRVAAWLATGDLIRNFTAVVHDISAGMTPAARLQALAPGGSFRTSDHQGVLSVDPQSYSRYDSLAGAVASVDAAGAARLYGTLKPRIEEAYKEQGFPDVPFDRTLERAIVRLLQTPIVQESAAVAPRGGKMFAYADSRLESLSPAQKQLLRMGPRNVRVIQETLREIALALGIPPDRLPPV
jgi:hypothetical protein